MSKKSTIILAFALAVIAFTAFILSWFAFPEPAAKIADIFGTAVLFIVCYLNGRVSAMADECDCEEASAL